MVGDLGERIEAVLREDHLAAGLQEEYFRAAAEMVFQSSMTITLTPCNVLRSDTRPPDMRP